MVISNSSGNNNNGTPYDGLANFKDLIRHRERRNSERCVIDNIKNGNIRFDITRKFNW